LAGADGILSPVRPRKRRFLWLTAVLVAASAAVQAQFPDAEKRPALEAPALDWIKANAKPMRADVPTSEELATLIGALGDQKVFALGEATHGDLQAQLLKSHLIRGLAKAGKIDSVLFEINRAPGVALDAYVNSGTGELADIIQNSGIFSIWRTDEFASMVLGLRAYVKETKKPIRIYGIDCQDACTDFAFAVKALAVHNKKLSASLAKELDAALRPQKPGTTFFAWIQAQKPESFAGMVSAGERLASALKGYKNVEGAYAAHAAVQALKAFELEFGSKTVDLTKAPPDYLSRRDVFMAQNLLTRNVNRKSAFWAHDLHVTGTLPQYIVDFGYRTLGSVVKKSLGAKYVTVTFAWAEGSFHAKLGTASDDPLEGQTKPLTPFSVLNNRPGELGEFLNRVGMERFWVDFRKADAATLAWGQTPYLRGWCGWLFDPAAWGTNPQEESLPLIPTTEMLVFYKKISPSTIWLPAVKTTGSGK
jgi:erythromycin esterase